MSPLYEYECKEHGNVMAVLMPIYEHHPEDMWAEEMEHAPTECRIKGCRFRRILSTFGGNFGDTPRHHRRSP